MFSCKTRRLLIVRSEPMPKITIEQIQRRVAELFGLEINQLKTRTNSRAIVVPRQIAMYMAREFTHASLPQIGRQFGCMHHTTVLHAIKKITYQRSNDSELTDVLEKLEKVFAQAVA